MLINENNMAAISRDYLSGMTIRELACKYPFKEGTINYWLRKMKILGEK